MHVLIFLYSFLDFYIFIAYLETYSLLFFTGPMLIAVFMTEMVIQCIICFYYYYYEMVQALLLAFVTVKKERKL